MRFLYFLSKSQFFSYKYYYILKINIPQFVFLFMIYWILVKI